MIKINGSNFDIKVPIIILMLSLYNIQTEFIFVRELRPANITVESRLFKSDSDDPVTSVPDFFVSYNIS